MPKLCSQDFFHDSKILDFPHCATYICKYNCQKRMLNSTKKKRRGQNSDKAVPIRFYEMASNGDFTFYAPLILHRRLSQHFARRDAYLRLCNKRFDQTFKFTKIDFTIKLVEGKNIEFENVKSETIFVV